MGVEHDSLAGSAMWRGVGSACLPDHREGPLNSAVESLTAAARWRPSPMDTAEPAVTVTTS
ncbi:hypothetical protein CSHISOI_04607 [Colletotrichum shisoi]|uniref:Uncharacterized protein n=1 Tax=Colletotrichum shisoi TaxID=2078593 RepID=A0A5Q4BVQ6_9PEZI|nr:hypothetical protein CSHISOI_04607 [Colletotrichum shisoi]